MKPDSKPDSSSSNSNRTLAKNMLFSVFGSLSYQGCLWLITVLVVILSSDYRNSGILAVAMATGNMFFAIGTYNMRTYQVSDIQGKLRQRDYVGFRIITIALAWLIMGPYALLVSDGTATIVATMLFLLFKTDESFADVLYGVDQRHERIDLIGLSQGMRGIIIVILFSVLLKLTGSLPASLATMCAGMVLVSLLFDIPRAGSLERIAPAFSLESTLWLLRTCLPIAVAPLLTNMVVSVPRQYFAHQFGTEALGTYAAIATPAVLIQAAARYLYLPILVPMAQLWEAKDYPQFYRSVRRTLLVMLAVSVPVVIVLSLVGSPLLPLVFGQSLSEHVYLFPFVLVSTAAISILWFLTDTLIICRDTFGQLMASGLAFASSLVLMVVCERVFFMNGINITVIVSISIGIIAALARIRRLRTRCMDRASAEHASTTQDKG